MKKYPTLSQLDLVTLNTYKGIYDILWFLKESFSFYHLKLSILFLDLFSCLLNFAFIEVLLLFMLITVLRYSISIIQGHVHCALCRSRISNLLSEIRWKFFNFFPPKLQAGYSIWLLFDRGSRSSGSVTKRHTFLYSAHQHHQGQTNF